MATETRMISISRDVLMTICNALNAEAGRFDQLSGDARGALSASVEVWRKKAADNRALSKLLISEWEGE